MIAFAGGMLSGLKKAAGYRDHDEDEQDLCSWISQIDEGMKSPCRRGLEPKLREDLTLRSRIKVFLPVLV